MSRTRHRLVALFLGALLLSSCSLTVGRDYRLNTELGYRHSAVISRRLSTVLASALPRLGAPRLAVLVAGFIVKVPVADRYYCPAGGMAGCDTTSEYTRSHPSDLASAIRDAAAHRSCVAITVYPPYNWTHKGRGNGCIYN